MTVDVNVQSSTKLKLIHKLTKFKMKGELNWIERLEVEYNLNKCHALHIPAKYVPVINCKVFSMF